MFAGVATSVADGTRDVLGDAALDAARFSAEAKDVAAFKAGNEPSSCSLFRGEVDVLLRSDEPNEGTPVAKGYCS